MKDQKFFWLRFGAVIPDPEAVGNKASAAKVSGAKAAKRPSGEMRFLAGTIRQRANVMGVVSFNLLTNKAFAFYVAPQEEFAKVFRDANEAMAMMADAHWKTWASGSHTVLTSIDIE